MELSEIHSCLKKMRYGYFETKGPYRSERPPGSNYLQRAGLVDIFPFVKLTDDGYFLLDICSSTDSAGKTLRELIDDSSNAETVNRLSDINGRLLHIGLEKAMYQLEMTLRNAQVSSSS